MKHIANKMRTLWVAKILYTETDASNPIQTQELLDCLNSLGLKSNLNTLYEDVDAIRRVMFPVKYVTRKGYYADIKKGGNNANRQ